MTDNLLAAAIDTLVQITEEITGREHHQWRLYELHVEHDRLARLYALDAVAVADLVGDPVEALLGRSADADADVDGALVVCGHGPTTQLVAVQRAGTQAADGPDALELLWGPLLHPSRSGQMLVPVLRRYLGMSSRAPHRGSRDVAARVASALLVHLARRGAELGDAQLAAAFVGNFTAELDGGDPWHRALADGLHGGSWACRAVEESLQQWVDEDLALALLDSRGIDPDDARVELASLIGERAAGAVFASLIATAR